MRRASSSGLMVALCRQVRAAHQFSADERRLDRLGIELI